LSSRTQPANIGFAVSNISMRRPGRTIVKAIGMIWPFLACMWGAWGQTSAKTPELYFYSSPTKQLFSPGENVMTNLSFWSRSEQPLYVSRLQNGAFVTFKVTGPDGHEVLWQDGGKGTKQYSASDFTVLKQYTQIKANRIISLKDGEGFAFDKPGQYSLTAEFSMDPSSRFAGAADRATPPVGVFQSKASFCIEACISEPFPVRNNAPKASLDAVRAFYNIITKYQNLGIPGGREKKALRPLLSKRLAHLLDSVQACDADYYRRFGETLRANTYKPSTPWLEEGLFTGPNDAATPRIFRILGSRAIGTGRVDVQLRFTTRQTYDPGLRLPDSYDHYEGVVTAILENNRWVIDDYVAMYENDELQRLSSGYPECKDDHWVGQTP
jgi:hypothetical protein